MNGADITHLQQENERLRQQFTDLSHEHGALRERTERLQVALDGSGDALWDWNIITGAAVFSPRFNELVGYPPDAVFTHRDSWLTLIHPDDVPQVTQTFQDHLAGRTAVWNSEHRLRHHSGEWSWVLLRGKVVARDAQGQPLRLAGTISDIHQRKQREDQLKRNQKLLQGIIDNAPLLIYAKDTQGRYTLISPQAATLVQSEPTQVLGKTDHDLFPAHIADALRHNEQQIIATERSMQSEELVAHDDGLHTYMSIKFPLYNEHQEVYAVCGISADISDLKRTEADLRTFQTIVENAPDAIGVVGSTGRFDYANTAYRTLFGYESLNGMPLMDVIADEEHSRVSEVIPKIMQEGSWQGMMEYKHKNGSLIPCQVTVFPLPTPGVESPPMAAIVRDMTEQVQADQERQRLQAQVITAQQRALRELSTPLLPIADGVLVMPLIGTVDSERAQLVLETLLEGVALHQAELAILDITGVQVIDTQIANVLIRAAQAVKLLGAQVVLTGIQPLIAQTLVHLDIDLGTMITRSTLQAGITYALTGK